MVVDLVRSAPDADLVSTLRTLPSQLLLLSRVAGRELLVVSSAQDVAGVAVAARLLLPSVSWYVLEFDDDVPVRGLSGLPPNSASPSAWRWANDDCAVRNESISS